MINNENEKRLQDTFTWERSVNFSDYNNVLARYQAQTCIENARGISLLDMPCGDGTLTEIMSKNFQRVVGVDAAASHLKVAQDRLPNVEFHHALIEELSLSEKFSTITMLNVLEHVNDPIEALQKASRFLEKDGVLQIHVPNSQAVNRKIAVLMGTLEKCDELSPFDIQIAGHRRSYDMASLCNDVKKSGLKIISTGGVFYKMLSTPQIDWFLKNGLWEEGGFGWGRVGASKRDWKAEFCRASYEYGKLHPEDCNVIYVCATLA